MVASLWAIGRRAHGVASGALLAVAIAGYGPALSLTVLIVGAQIARSLLRERAAIAFAVQFRADFVLLLALGSWEPLRLAGWLELARLGVPLVVGRRATTGLPLKLRSILEGAVRIAA